jgi:hypothetical protein
MNFTCFKHGSTQSTLREFGRVTEKSPNSVQEI